MSDLLKDIGKGIIGFLIILFVLKIATLSFKFYILHSIEFADYIEELILFIIPTEATTLERFGKYPIAAVITLFLYKKYVK